MPVVGNVTLPLAGVSMGLPEWAMVQFAIGVFFWPIVTMMGLSPTSSSQAAQVFVVMSFSIALHGRGHITIAVEPALSDYFVRWTLRRNSAGDMP